MLWIFSSVVNNVESDVDFLPWMLRLPVETQRLFDLVWD